MIDAVAINAHHTFLTLERVILTLTATEHATFDIGCVAGW